MGDFFNLNMLLKLCAAALGTTGFAVLFGVRTKHLALAGVGGFFTYAVFYTFNFIGSSIFVCAFTSALFAALYSEICARTNKAPNAVFLIPCGIPIVPGSELYYTMRYLLEKDLASSGKYLSNAFMIGLGIAGGIVVISIISNHFYRFYLCNELLHGIHIRLLENRGKHNVRIKFFNNVN